MIKLVFCLRRRADLTREEFQEYWRTQHGPLVASHASKLGIVRYAQLHAVPDEISLAIAGARHAPEPFDGFAELWFDSLEALGAAGSTPEGSAAAAELFTDEQRFIDHARSPLVIVNEHVIVEPAA